MSEKFFEKYKRFSKAEAGVYRAPEGSKDKNLNLVLLKEYVGETKLFTDEEITEAIKVKFRKEEVYSKKIKAYLGEGF